MSLCVLKVQHKLEFRQNTESIRLPRFVIAAGQLLLTLLEEDRYTWIQDTATVTRGRQVQEGHVVLEKDR